MVNTEIRLIMFFAAKDGESLYSQQKILVRWFLKCRCSLLLSPVWPLPICLDSWTWHSRFLCNIALYSIRPCFYHQSHPQVGIVFALLHPFILSRVISPLISSSILGIYWPGEFLFQNPIICLFYCSWGSQGKNTEVVCHSLLQWTIFC